MRLFSWHRAASWIGEIGMRYALRPADRSTANFAAGIMAVAALLTGCGTPGQGHGGSGPNGSAAPLARTQTSGPEWGSRAEALALARQLLSRLALPPGARAARMPVVPRLLRQPASSIAAIGLVDVHRLFSLPQRPPAVQRFLLTHAPASMRRYEHGEESSPAGTQMQDVSYEPRSVPGGIFRAQLVAAVVPGPGATSLLRADAEVVWFPRRTAVEHLDPASFRRVIVSARVLNPRPSTVTRVITSPAVIARLAGLLNGLPAAPGLGMSCPAMLTTYRVKFSAGAGRAPETTATAAGCLTDQITVNGKAQPALWDRSERLAAAASKLLRVTPQG
jgi:hypothetical protein